MAELSFAWVAPVRPDHVVDLDSLLHAVDGDLRNPPAEQRLLRLGTLEMLHFASLTVFNRQSARPLLVFESNIDAPGWRWRGYDLYVTKLIEAGAEVLHKIYAHCVGYSRTSGGSDDLRRYLRRHRVRAKLHHVGHHNRPLPVIHGDSALRARIVALIERNRQLQDLNPTMLREAIREAVDSPPSKSKYWVPVVDAARGVRWIPQKIDFIPAWRIFHLLSVVVAAAASFAVVGISAGLLTRSWITSWIPALMFSTPGVWASGALTATSLFLMLSMLYVRARMATGTGRGAVPRQGHIAALKTREDRWTQNHIAGLTELGGPWPLRVLYALRLRIVFYVLNLYYRGVYRRGKLDRIPSIHFAQWSLCDGWPGRRVLFLVNYDGGWETYLDDFFRTLAAGVAFIWWHTAGFPVTSNTTELKNWVRINQAPESVWYRAPVYDGLTVGAINNNTRVREDLISELHRFERMAWVARLFVIPENVRWLVKQWNWLMGRLTVTE